MYIPDFRGKRRWRCAYSELDQRFRNNIPVLVVTPRHAVAERVEGLNAGADDYLAKPFDLAEFEARVAALLRRGTPEQASTVQGTDKHNLPDPPLSLTRHASRASWKSCSRGRARS